jgi:uncharacterized iron-regulated protein
MGNTAKDSARGRRSNRAWEQRAVTGITQEIHALDPIAERKYLRDFRDVFRSYHREVTAEQFNRELLHADVILLGDYHTLPAAQRYAAQLVTQLAEDGKGSGFSLGLEAVFAADQPPLDAWWRKEITEHELRLALRFDEDWGYAWEPVRNLLETAQRHRVPVYGLDCGPRSNLRAIRRRDRHAATRIAEIRERSPQRPVLALFGESHLAPGHLPALVRAQRPRDKVLTVLQNCDALYWQLDGNRNGARPVVEVCDQVFCVFTASLFEKYDSYRTYLHSEDDVVFRAKSR